MSSEDPFGGLFGDPDDLRRRMEEFAQQMQGAQKVAWADNAIKLAVVADSVDPDTGAGEHASRPIVTGEVEMDIEEAVALMVQHRIRRLPVTEQEDLAGIVTIDDLAVRAGDLTAAHQITAEVARAALPEFYFHQRGG